MGPTECKASCDDKMCKSDKDMKKKWKEIIRSRCEREGLDFERLNRPKSKPFFQQKKK